MKNVVIGVVGAGRATELHMGGYHRVNNAAIRLKTIMARRQEQLLPAKEKYGFEECTTDFDNLIKDEEINLIDICTPPYVHTEQIKKALLAGKNVICEKPLTGYFGETEGNDLIGDKISKKVMYEKLLNDLEELKTVVDKSSGRFMYAENFIYAPAIQKAAAIIKARKSRILFIKGEECLKGSSSKVAGYWSKTGGGSLIRLGSHPISAALWLKQFEGKCRGEDIELQSIVADMGRVTPSLSEYEHRHIKADPIDVEDTSTISMTFSDGTKSTIIANDTLLGGSRNHVECFCNDTVIDCNLTLSDLMKTYMVDEDGMDNVDFSEMLPITTGWNNPLVADEIIRGYAGEIQDFVECVALDKEPESGFKLAYDTIKAIYAAYYADETGQRVYLK